MKGFHTNIEQKTLKNEHYREVLFTTDRSQLVVMSLKPGEEIPTEVHEDHDQFIRVEAGEGVVVMDGEKIQVGDGSAVVIPAGVKHNVYNASDSESLRLYTLYTPPEHPDKVIDQTPEEAQAREESEG